MRYEGKTEADAIAAAAQAIGVPAAELKYRVVRDERSFWGGRVVEIELEEPARPEPRESRAEKPEEQEPEPGSGLELPAAAGGGAPAAAESRPPRGGDGRGGVRRGGGDADRAPFRGGLLRRDPAAPRQGDALRVDRRRRRAAARLRRRRVERPGSPDGAHRLQAAGAGPSIRAWTPRGSGRISASRWKSSPCAPRRRPNARTGRNSCRRSPPPNGA